MENGKWKMENGKHLGKSRYKTTLITVLIYYCVKILKKEPI
jgi:hypothetical protein